MRGDKSFAYDLIVRYGAVNSRVVLLLRSIEAKPQSPRFVLLHSPSINQVRPGSRRGFTLISEVFFSLEGILSG